MRDLLVALVDVQGRGVQERVDGVRVLVPQLDDAQLRVDHVDGDGAALGGGQLDPVAPRAVLESIVAPGTTW